MYTLYILVAKPASQECPVWTAKPRLNPTNHNSYLHLSFLLTFLHDMYNYYYIDICMYVYRAVGSHALAYVWIWGHKYTYYTHVGIYISMYSCMYVYAYMLFNVYIKTCIWADITSVDRHTCIYTYIHITYMHAYINVYICMHIGIHVHRQTCMRIHLCLYVHKYMY